MVTTWVLRRSKAVSSSIRHQVLIPSTSNLRINHYKRSIWKTRPCSHPQGGIDSEAPPLPVVRRPKRRCCRYVAIISCRLDLFSITNCITDSPPGVPSSLFETPYEITKYKDSCFHAITMMRSYKKFSFEELRLSYPLKRTLKTENILVAHSNKGLLFFAVFVDIILSVLQ